MTRRKKISTRINLFVKIFPCHFLLKLCQTPMFVLFVWLDEMFFLSFLCCARIFRNKNLRFWKNFFKKFLSVCLVDICSTRIGVYFFWKINKLAFSRLRNVWLLPLKKCSQYGWKIETNSSKWNEFIWFFVFYKQK